MRGIQGVGNLDGEVQQCIDIQRLAFNAPLQCLALQQLHCDEGLASMLPDLMDGADVRMVEGGSGARFATKTLQRLPVLRQVFREELQRHMPTEAEIFGLIDHTHASAAELAQHAVVGDGLADHR